MWKLTRLLPWRGRAHSPPGRFVYFAQLLFLKPAYREMLILLCIPIILAALAMPLLQNAAFRDHFATLSALGQSAFTKSSDPILDDAAVVGASAGLANQIRQRLAVFSDAEGVSTNVEEIRQDLLALPATADVAVRVRDDRHLAIDVVEKVPAFVWHIDGMYVLVDEDGHRLMTIADRYSRPDLFLISGAGANSRVDEAMAIYNHSWKLTRMIRGLVRVGERRWDIVLDRGRVIMLPEREPLAALPLLDALDGTHDLYNLYLAVIDLRNGGQIVVRKRRER